MLTKRFVTFSLLFAGLLSFAGCNQNATLDYTQESNWVAKPATLDKPVDVFYVYPTIYGQFDPSNMDISDPALQAKAQCLMVTQAGVYSDSANLFAPYYRQMSMARLDPTQNMYENQFFLVGYHDVAACFEYYLENLNPDRPFILAGHSQGSMVLNLLMQNYFDDPALQERLVAAYLIGYSITQDDIQRCPWLKPAQNATDTGVVISYNTQAPGTTDSPVLLEGAICINPLNWRTDDQRACASQNLGAVFFQDGSTEIAREIPNYTSAQINLATGALETTPPETLSTSSFPAGVFHIYDYPFWYRNLQQNTQQRIDAYFIR